MRETLSKLQIALTAVLLLVGCNGRSQPNIDGSVDYKTELAPLIGIWESEGATALIVERKGDKIIIRNPTNEVWRFEITDVAKVDQSIFFTQRSYLLDGSSHPFNGVACKCKISPKDGDPDALVYALTSEQSKDIPPDVLRRSKVKT